MGYKQNAQYGRFLGEVTGWSRDSNGWRYHTLSLCQVHVPPEGYIGMSREGTVYEVRYMRMRQFPANGTTR